MSEPKRTSDRKGERERHNIRKRRPWPQSTWHDAKVYEGPGYKYPEHPDQDDGFYGHYLPSHFKKTDIVSTHGKE